MTTSERPSFRNYTMKGYCMGSGSLGPNIVQGANVLFDSFISQGPDEKESKKIK